LYAAATGAGLASALRGVAAVDAASGAVAHALRCVAAARAGDAARLTALCDEDDVRMAPCLVDLLLPAARRGAAARVVAAFRPTVPLSDAARWLGLADDEAGAAQLLAEAGARVEGGVVVTREGEAGAVGPRAPPPPLPRSPLSYKKRDRHADKKKEKKAKHKKEKKARRR
jgi:hypothetical protein